jgi:hypothetical protein
MKSFRPPASGFWLLKGSKQMQAVAGSRVGESKPAASSQRPEA